MGSFAGKTYWKLGASHKRKQKLPGWPQREEMESLLERLSQGTSYNRKRGRGPWQGGAELVLIAHGQYWEWAGEVDSVLAAWRGGCWWKRAAHPEGKGKSRKWQWWSRDCSSHYTSCCDPQHLGNTEPVTNQRYCQAPHPLYSQRNVLLVSNSPHPT